jgi:hypothetical protein
MNPVAENEDRPHPSNGPFYTAIAAAVLPAAQLLAIALGMPINTPTVLSIIIPDVTIAALVLAVSLGWIFISIGRLHRQPARVLPTVIILGVTMVELFVIVVICSQVPMSR